MTDYEKYLVARYYYARGIDYISDVEYNSLCDKHGWDKGGWDADPEPISILKEYNLKQVQTLPSYKTESIESYSSYILVPPINSRTRVSLKIDGYNVRLFYRDGELVDAKTRTRQTHATSRDLSLIYPMFPKTINIKGDIVVVGELVVNKNKFEEYKNLRGIKSPRNSVSTIIANGDYEYADFYTFNILSDSIIKEDIYDILCDLGFEVPPHSYIDTTDELMNACIVLGMKTGHIYSDGVVIENNSMQIALRDFKWKEQELIGQIKGFTLSRSTYGYTVMCLLDPIVNFSGSTITRASITNLATLEELDLDVGDKVVLVGKSNVTYCIDIEKTRALKSTQ